MNKEQRAACVDILFEPFKYNIGMNKLADVPGINPAEMENFVEDAYWKLMGWVEDDVRVR